MDKSFKERTEWQLGTIVDMLLLCLFPIQIVFTMTS
jgi:hypothetical protein